MRFSDILNSGDSRDEVALLDAHGAAAWFELSSRAGELQRRFAPTLARRRVGVQLTANAAGIATLAALDRLDCDVYLLDDQLSETKCDALIKPYGLTAVLTTSSLDIAERRLEPSQPGSGSSTVTLLTSGTEGRPKAVRHTWESLSRPVRSTRDVKDQRWLLTFRPHLYAGTQVLLQCLSNHGTLVVPPPDGSPDEVASMIRDTQVQYVSATPSYWRRMLLFANHETLAAAPVRQITLGGEAADQAILDGLRRLFPKARVAHIYATTELGRCFSVGDGRAGFPSEYLAHPTADGVEMQIHDGQLHVRSANAMLGYVGSESDPINETWFATGDLVETVGDRIFFVGRTGDMINVGGNKVRPLTVERLLRTVEGVADVRIYGVSSSITGQLVACQLVLQVGAEADQVRAAVVRSAAENLASYERPRVIEFVSQLELTDAGKVSRQIDTPSR